MTLAYGKTPPSHNDPEVQSVNRCLTRLGLALRPGAWRVDVYPVLRHVLFSCVFVTTNIDVYLIRYIPGYLRELRAGHEEELALFKGQLNVVKEKMVCMFSHSYIPFRAQQT
jgi:hypothetical protein